MKKHRIVIVGGGTAGAISSSYIKQCYGDHVEVVLIYDHQNPNIGIGESLTPMINNYLRFVGIDKSDLIKNVNATVKLGIKFKNWCNQNDEFYHPFLEKNLTGAFGQNFEAAYDIVNDVYDHDIAYSKDFFLKNRIPSDNDAIQSLHINGDLFSKFIIEKFRSKLTIIDDKVQQVVITNQGIISKIILEKYGDFSGDFFIDASGFSSVLFKNLPNQWIDKTSWLPLNRCIPTPVEHNLKVLPVCTTAEATDQGWILQVPLSNRWGCGFLYSSDFISDESALINFSKFLENKYNVKNFKEKIIKFKSGYWEKQWVGNCLSIGLSSGFSEPLEATNIHQSILQLEKFTALYNFQFCNYDINEYNNSMQSFYERVYLFLRFCYCTNRIDSEFWKYMTNNKPYEILNFEEKISNNILNVYSMSDDIFNYDNFTKIAYGLKKINKNSYKECLLRKNVYNFAKNNSMIIKNIKKQTFNNSIDHLTYIKQHLNQNNTNFYTK